MGLKAVDILKSKDFRFGLFSYRLKEIDEAIKELEELENRSCDNCKYYQPSDGDIREEIKDQWIECINIYVETREICNLKDFYCNKWESK